MICCADIADTPRAFATIFHADALRYFDADI